MGGEPDRYAAARKLFVRDDEFDRDRRQYGIFDCLPPALKEWWLIRAQRFAERLSD